MDETYALDVKELRYSKISEYIHAIITGKSPSKNETWPGVTGLRICISWISRRSSDAVEFTRSEAAFDGDLRLDLVKNKCEP